MGYPTIDKFDLNFIKRTKENVATFKGDNSFTHLINSLVGLIFVPHEFNNKKKRKFKTDFFNQSISSFPELAEIFNGISKLTNEENTIFDQRKFYHKNNTGLELTINETTVGNLIRLFRNAIAHQNITPVKEGDAWKGIIIKNFKNENLEKKNDFNFEAYLTQKEVRLFSTFISEEYLKNVIV